MHRWGGFSFWGVVVLMIETDIDKLQTAIEACLNALPPGARSSSLVIAQGLSKLPPYGHSYVDPKDSADVRWNIVKNASGGHCVLVAVRGGEYIAMPIDR